MMATVEEVKTMYKWLKAYVKEFGKDFPFSVVADRNEYEICRIIQYCVEHTTEYSDAVAAKALVGTAKVGETKI